MMTEDANRNEPPAPESEDIIFECPQCGKSLEIDARGAGYLIVCPDCKNEIQVPSWNDFEEAREAQLEPGEPVDTQRIEAAALLDQLQARVDELEKKQRADDVCFKRLGDEITLIQAALDRITEIVESRHTES